MPPVIHILRIDALSIYIGPEGKLQSVFGPRPIISPTFEPNTGFYLISVILEPFATPEVIRIWHAGSDNDGYKISVAVCLNLPKTMYLPLKMSDQIRVADEDGTAQPLFTNPDVSPSCWGVQRLIIVGESLIPADDYHALETESREFGGITVAGSILRDGQPQLTDNWIAVIPGFQPPPFPGFNRVIREEWRRPDP